MPHIIIIIQTHRSRFMLPPSDNTIYQTPAKQILIFAQVYTFYPKTSNIKPESLRLLGINLQVQKHTRLVRITIVY